MKPNLVLVPLALEWVIVASTIAPLWLGMFSKRPKLGIAMWLLLFFSAAVATGVAAALAVWGVIDNFNNLEQHRQNLPLTIAFSLAPWLLFALAGVAINLINLKLEPIIQRFKAVLTSPSLPARPYKKFQKVPVEIIQLEALAAFSTDRPNRRILLSSMAVNELSEPELEAVLWHEYAHLRMGHPLLKRLVRLVATLTGFVKASKVMNHEVDRLCELAADDFALKHVDAALLASVRSKFD